METFEEHYASMMDTIRKRMPDADFALIDKAVDYANKKHAAQKRKDGSPYIIHPLAVAQIVTEMGLDMDAILGALLHDCIEDTDASHEEIEKLFGPTVAELVEGVTKLTRADFSSREQAQMENLRKMFMAMSKDIRVVLIKIADRLHNIRTMQYQSPEKQIAKCQETMDIYAPLAHRLGMQKVKWELEDTSLKYLAPKEYNEITAYLQEHKDQDESFMRTIQEKITQRLTAMGIHNTTYGRIKHVYSIYRKMQAQGKRMDELYDIYRHSAIQVLRVSAATGAGIPELCAAIAGKLNAFTGNSGVGKSSILNALSPQLTLPVGEVSKALGRGRHTTRHVEMFSLGGDTWVIDTPGFSSFDTQEMDLELKEHLPETFPEFAPYADQCRFVGCSHTREKGCRVLQAVKDGDIHPSRHRSYVRLYQELKDLKAWEKK